MRDEGWVAADSTAEVMVKVGAVGALLGLLASSSDANVLGSTVCALAVLSKCGASPLKNCVCVVAIYSRCNGICKHAELLSPPPDRTHRPHAMLRASQQTGNDASVSN